MQSKEVPARRSPVGPLYALATVAALTLLACGSSEVPAGGADAADAGVDGGPADDAGTGGPADAGREDGGNGTTDGGADAGPEDDGGEPDAGAEADGGADGGDAGAADGGAADGGDPGDGGTAPSLGVRYPASARHSPLPPELADGLWRVAARDPALEDRVFAKVGDSISTGPDFLACFAEPGVDLSGHPELEAGVAWFLGGDAGDVTPFARESEATERGLHAYEILEGDPSRLDRELAAVAPRFAVVMLGTNDLTWRPPDVYAADLLAIVDALLARGVIPLLSTVPPRTDDATYAARVPRFNAIVRAIAQGRQVPLMDYHGALLDVPDFGLSTDGVHPTADFQSPAAPCDFSAAGLTFGMNVRNLLTMEALDRARLAVLEAAPPDAEAPRLTGEGTFEAPAEAGAPPFSDLRDAARVGPGTREAYEGCPGPALEGPELVYALELPAAARLVLDLDRLADTRAEVLVLDPADGTCVARDPTHLELDLGAGRWWLVVDTGSPEAAGPVVLSALAR